MRHTYHREGVTDLSAFREEAQRRLLDKYYPDETVIHLHDKELSCKENKHETVLFEKPEATVDPESGILTWDN